MKILLIDHYAGCESMGMEYRPYYLAREWQTCGTAVTILGASYSHLRASQPVVRNDLDTTVMDGVTFRWLRTSRYSGNGLGRIANILQFVGKLFAYAQRIAREEKPDVVICSSTYPIDIYPGAAIARHANGRLAFEVHDLWPLTPMLLGGYGRRHPYVQLLQRAEDWAYKRADVVVSILPMTRGYMVGRGLDPRKFIHIPNGISLPQAADDLPTSIAGGIDMEKKRGRFLVGFAGGFNLNMALETLVEAARILAGRDIAFILVGDGQRREHLAQEIARLKLENFTIFGRIPKRSVQSFLRRMDVLAIPWHRNPLYRFGISPNKVFDYMLSGRPILQASDAANDLVTDAQCGLTVEPENPAAFAAAVMHLRDLPPSERERMGANGRRFVIAHHDYRVLASRFLEAIVPEKAAATLLSGDAARRVRGRWVGLADG
jgi:glycosyltransferase involved in cell wall biosynthesis